ncbi:K02A2.6-like, partial [Cordylochernes scorpioides]
MPFGLANAPSYFQSVMDRVLAGIEGVICYIDDLLIATVSVEKHLAVLKTVFLRLEKYNIKLKKDKCKFVQREIEYLGHLIKEDGIRPLDHKVQALQKAKSPTNISELKSFLGLVNYYGKFIPNLPDLLRPLHELLHKKNCWSWTKEYEEAIEKCKSSITSERVLVPYDTTLPLFLATDASQIGIGAVLSHVIGGQERPIMFASGTLSGAERNYSQIEREALAIIYGVTKFHQFIYGRRFTLITDQKPLVSILGPKSGIPTLSTSRLQKWAIILSAYTYDIKFKKTQDHGNADLLSRLSVESGETSRLDNIYALSYMEDLPITAEEIRIETQKDEVLSIVKCYTQHGWPERVPDHLRPYFQRKLELTVDGECLLWGDAGHYSFLSQTELVELLTRDPFRDEQNEDTLSKILLAYRSTPHETTNKAPLELFIGRSLRTRLSIIHPNLESRVKEQQARQMKYDHGFQQDEFGIDDMVWCRNFRGGDRWIPGRIVGRKGSRVNTVLIHGQIKSYHRDQIRKRWENGGDEDRQYGRQREETDIIVPEADMPNRGRSESPLIETARQQRDSGLVDQNDGGISGESSRSPDPEANGLPNDWKDLIVAAQPTDATKWFHIAASIEQNRASIQFKPKNKIHLATKNNDNRKNVCPFWCPICSKKGIKIKHWVTDCEDYDPNYKKDRPNQNTSVKQVCGAPELLNVSTLTNTPTQGAFKLINISVEVNGIPAQAFVDTGATVSIINWRLFKRTRLQLQPNSDIHISQADGVTRTCGSLQTKVRIDKLIKPVTLHVMKNFKYPLLIGLDVASLFNILIDVKDKTIYTKFDGLQNPILVNHLEEIREHELKELLEHNRNVFSQHAIDLGKVAIQHKIITKSEQPISLRPYRRPLKEYEEIAEQVKELLEHKLIRTSDSPWAFPVVMVPKKDGNKRMCIDYRRLNEITLDDRQPLPHIQDMFDRLHGSRFFSTLDVAWGYWQIEMDPQSIQKTAFVTKDGHYEFLVMPFGLKNAASTFQRIIQHILGELLWKGTCSFQDDILVYTKTWQEHIELLSKVFDKLRQYNMKLKLSKCIFGRTEVKYLGHIISHNQLKPDPGKDFSKISFPLVRLTRKNQPFFWNEEVEESFAKLKMALSTKPVLAIYNPDYPSKVYTDASKYGIGAILTQIGPDNEEHVIAYYSKTLQPHQENYSAYEMECLAVIQATDHFRVYIENQPFEIITDHAALQWLFTMKKPKPKYFRWILSLSSKSCNIVHRSGKQQTHVDALSRLHVVNIATQELQEHQQNSDLSFLKNSHTHDGVVMIKQKGVFKAVVPNSLTKKILEEYHDSLSHPSITKTCKLITQCYWWKGITTDIKNYVRSCKSCQLVKEYNEETETFDTFYERLEQFLILEEAGDEKKKAYLLTLMGSKTYGVLKNLCSPILPKDKTFDNLINILKRHFSPKRSIVVERFIFFKRMQLKEESISDYLVEIKRLASSCNFGNFLEDSLRDKMVCGLYNAKIQNRILSEGDISLAKVIEIALSMEAAEKNTKLFHLEQGEDCVDKLRMERKVESNFQNGKCKHCGKQHKELCRFKEAICFKCNKKGHIASICWSSRRNLRQHQNQPGNIHQIGDQEEEEEYVQKIISVTIPEYKINFASSDPPYLMELKVEGNFIKFEMDTGSGLTLISEKDFKDSLQHLKLEKASIIVRTYDGTVVPILGKINVKVECQDITYKLRALVVKGEKRALMGREWINRLKLGCFAVKHMPVEITIEEILKENQALFVETTEPIKGFTFSVNMCDVNPIFHKARPVPFAIRPAVTEALDKMVAKGYLCEVASSKWATPVVVVPKKNKEIRICCDFKVTLNKYLDTAAYPLPTQQDLFSTLAKGKYFSKLDLRNAYLQLEVDPGTRPLLTINTHKGLFRFKRMPFGLANAPSYFQSVMDRVLSGIGGVICYIDDVLIATASIEEHLALLKTIFARLAKYNIKLKKEKCLFLQKEIEYLGHLVTEEGIRPLDHKVQAIQKAKTPTNISELRSFLGLVNFYGKFIPNLPELLKPLHELLHKKRPWVWTKECGEAIDKCKNSITSERVLVPYDATLPLCLATDASQIGVGAVLSHIIEGQERPIMFASRTLSEAEQNYSQIEKEALAIIYGVTKFHQFIYGRKFILITDHKPLVTILGSRSGIPTLSTSRLQRWALILSAYTYDIKFRRTQDHGNADLLSRFPVGCEEIPRLNNVYALSYVEELPITAEEIATETEKDEVLSLAKFYTQQGWPEKVADHLRPYFQRKLELTVDGECLVWGMRVVIPPSLRIKMLNCLHETHSGMNKMKAVARSHFWWPNLDTQIEFLVNKCRSCQQSQDGPNKGKWQPWRWSTRPWQRIHIDFANKENINLLIVVDSHSKWIEAIPMRETTTRKTIEQLRRLFSSYGLPEELVSDNGPQFTGSEMKGFLEGNGIKQTLIPAYHPQSNGLAERAVRTIKTALDKNKRKIGDTIQDTLSKVLLAYRSTPHVTTGKTPSELFIGRALRTRVSLIHPSLTSRVRDQQARQMKYDRRTQLEEFQIDDLVWCKNFRGGDKWIPGKIVGKKGTRVYTILIHGQVKAYHRDQIRKRWRNGEEAESGDGERQPEHSRGAGPSAIISEVVRDRGYMESLSPGLTSQRSDQDSEVQSDTDDGKSLEPLRSLDPEALKEEGPVLRRNPPRARRPPDISRLDSTLQLVERLDRYPLRNKRKIDSVEPEETSMNVNKEGTQDDREDLSSLIRKIVREEIQQALDSPHEEPKIAVIEDLVREEIVKTLAPRSEPTISRPLSPRPVSNPKFEAQPRNPHPTSQYQKQGRRRDTNEWRTTEGRPICFYCGRPDHVVRYCRDRKRHNEERRKEYFQRKQDAM